MEILEVSFYVQKSDELSASPKDRDDPSDDTRIIKSKNVLIETAPVFEKFMMEATNEGMVMDVIRKEINRTEATFDFYTTSLIKYSELQDVYSEEVGEALMDRCTDYVPISLFSTELDDSEKKLVLNVPSESSADVVRALFALTMRATYRSMKNKDLQLARGERREMVQMLAGIKGTYHEGKLNEVYTVLDVLRAYNKAFYMNRNDYMPYIIAFLMFNYPDVTFPVAKWEESIAKKYNAKSIVGPPLIKIGTQYYLNTGYSTPVVIEKRRVIIENYKMCVLHDYLNGQVSEDEILVLFASQLNAADLKRIKDRYESKNRYEEERITLDQLAISLL